MTFFLNLNQVVFVPKPNQSLKLCRERLEVKLAVAWDSAALSASCFCSVAPPFTPLVFYFHLLWLSLLDNRLDMSVRCFWVALPCLQLLLKPEEQLFLLDCPPFCQAFTSWTWPSANLCRAAPRNMHSLKTTEPERWHECILLCSFSKHTNTFCFAHTIYY